MNTPEPQPRRGRPGTWKYLGYWTGSGECEQIDLETTMSHLPDNDVLSAGLIDQMMSKSGQPFLRGLQTHAWYLWDGTVYAVRKERLGADLTREYAMHYCLLAERIKQAANAAAAGKLGTGASREDITKAGAELLKPWGKHLSYRDRIMMDAGQRALLNELERRAGEDDGQFDSASGQIVVGNGVLDAGFILDNRGQVKLEQHSPERRVTRRTGREVVYDPDARCPVFDDFLATSVADEQQRWWLLWRTASALFGRMPRKGFLNLIGEHDSGKSTFLEIMAELAGGYARTVPIQTFLAKRGGGNGFLEAGLRGARLVSASEPEPGGRYDAGLMKTLTGRDRQRTADKYEKSIEWAPQLTIMIASNGPIRFATSDEAMMTRQEVIRFARGYAEADEHLAERLRAELPGIFTALIETLRQEAWFGAPPLPSSVITEREHLASETEDALRFVQEGLESGWLAEVEAGSVPVSACVPVDWLFKHYRNWAEDTERVKVPLGRKDFSEVVGRRYLRERSSTWRFTGLVTQDRTALMQ